MYYVIPIKCGRVLVIGQRWLSCCFRSMRSIDIINFWTHKTSLYDTCGSRMSLRRASKLKQAIHGVTDVLSLSYNSSRFFVIIYAFIAIVPIGDLACSNPYATYPIEDSNQRWYRCWVFSSDGSFFTIEMFMILQIERSTLSLLSYRIFV